MRKVLSLLATGVLGASLGFAQSTAPASPAPQDQPAASQQDPRPADKSAASPAHTTGEAKQNSDAARQDAAKANDNPQAARAESADAANADRQQPQRAEGGIPWLWIALGALGLIVLFSLLGRRDPDRVGDRVTVIDRDRRTDDTVIDRRDDDIRRVG